MHVQPIHIVYIYTHTLKGRMIQKHTAFTLLNIHLKTKQILNASQQTNPTSINSDFLAHSLSALRVSGGLASPPVIDL